MPLKKTVAMERRIDLASLFCLIARHGPAVLLALLVLGCSVLGFVLLKNMREKRRRRMRRAAAAAERRGSGATHGDAAHGLEEEEEEEEEEPGRQIRSGSTGFIWDNSKQEKIWNASDDNSQDDFREQTHSHGQVRQRRTASERKPYKEKVPKRDGTIDKAQHAFFWEWNSHRTQSYAEEAVQNNTHKLEEEVAQDIHEAKEEEEEKMPDADSNEDLTLTNTDLSEGELRQEESVQFTFNSQSCSCPAPNLSVNDRNENTREINTKHQESELNGGFAPVTGPCKEDKHDPEQKTIEKNMESGKSSCLNDEKQEPSNDETISTTLSAEEKEEHLLVDGQMDEPEPSKLGKTEESALLANLNISDTIDVKDLSLDGQQIDQSGPCPQEQSHQTTELLTDKDLSTCQKVKENVNNIEFPDATLSENINKSIANAISHSVDVDMAKDDGIVNQEAATNVKIETSILSENTCLQDQQSQEIATPVLCGNQAHMGNLSDQIDMTEEQQQQTLPICKETGSNAVDCIEVQSSSIDSKQVDCVAPLPPNQLTEVLDEETSPSGLPADVKTENLSITDTTTPSNEQSKHNTLDTETTFTPALDIETKQAAKYTVTDTIEISAATITNKIECIVEQMVADAYKEVRQTTLETKSVQLDEKSLEQPSVVQQLQEGFGIDNANVTSSAIDTHLGQVFSQEESKEDAFCSKMAAQITEEVLSTVCSLELSNLKVGSENQRDITSCVASNSFSQTNIDGNNISIPAQEIIQVAEQKEEHETLTISGNDISIPLVDANLIETAAVEVKSLQMDEDVNLEGMSVPLVPNMDCVILTETKIVGNLKTTVEKSLQNPPKMLPETEFGNVSLTNEENLSEIQPVIKMEMFENTATSIELETKEPKISLDENKDVSRSIEKVGRKVVIVCRTLEASVSAVEISDSEDIESETSNLELKSSGISTHQDYLGDRVMANEGFSIDVVASCDTLAATPPIEDPTIQETCKNSDLTSGSALDFAQDGAAVMKSIELTDSVSSPCLESGISSMTVSPEMEETCKEIGQCENTSCKMFDTEGNVSNINLTREEVNTYGKEDAVSMDIGPLVSSPVQVPATEDLIDETLVINEDSFGSDIEEGYQKAMEDVIMEVVHNDKILSDDMTNKEVKLVDEKKEQACATNKEEGEKVDCEKTDISIMEATMDHNEWIIDGGYQVLPWMNVTSSRDATSSKQTEDLVAGKPPTSSTTEDCTENAKKVLAVQPMPQNVNVTFRVHYLPLSPYQTVAVTGDQQELGAWKSVVPLEKTKDGYWSCVVGLPAESHVEWKFVLLEKGEVSRWEECGNRLLYTGLGDDLLVHKWWGIL